MKNKTKSPKTKSLSQNYHVTGLFLGTPQKLSRQVLEIKCKNSLLENQDLLVVMMNPGGSKPLRWKNTFNRFVETIPDKTQYQIMRFMEETKIEYARVINLSNICQKKSIKFYANIKKEIQLNTHSLFCPLNKSILDQVFIRNIPVLIGWGCNSKLRPLTFPAMDYIKVNCQFYFGDVKNTEENKYYHPLKRISKNEKKSARWLERCKVSYKKNALKIHYTTFDENNSSNIN